MVSVRGISRHVIRTNSRLWHPSSATATLTTPNPSPAKLPLWVFAGGRDPVVPLRYFYPALNKLEALGHPEVRFTVEEDLGHLTWVRVYEGQDLYRLAARPDPANKKGRQLRCLPVRLQTNSFADQNEPLIPSRICRPGANAVRGMYGSSRKYVSCCSFVMFCISRLIETSVSVGSL